MADESLRLELLRLLNDPEADTRWHHIIDSLESAKDRDVDQELWALTGLGLAYVDRAGQANATQGWRWRLTERGARVAEDADAFVPADPDGYLAALKDRIPDLDDVIAKYVDEALIAHTAGAYTAAVVMIGVAAERGFQILGEAFESSLTGAAAAKFSEILGNPRQNYAAKFAEFRKRVEPLRRDLPSELSDGMEMMFDGVAHLLRVNRNDAGHPTGRSFDVGVAYTSLQMFAMYLERLEGLRNYFLQHPSGGMKPR